MNTTHSEGNDNLKRAESYYNAMLAKKFDVMTAYLHEHVDFISPLASMHGRDAVGSAAKNLSQILQDIHIRSKFAADNQIVLVYDFLFPAPIGVLRAAVLMEFTDKLISKIELFYDGRPFEKK